MGIYREESKELKQYQNNNFKIYYKLQDKEVIKDIEQAILEGYNKAIEYFEIKNYDKDIIVYIYSSIEELHLEVFGEKREEWGVCCGDGNDTLKIVSPANPGKIHDYKTMLEMI